MATQSVTIQSQAAAAGGNGRLSFFLLLPLSVLLMGGLMGLVLVNPGITPEAVVQTSSESLPGFSSLGGLSPVFTAEVQAWTVDILRWAGSAGLDPNMAATVMQIESCGDPQALSRSGAMGLFQVMPFHFSEGENGFDTETNARRGMDYLQRSLETAGGDPRLAFAGYNGGIGVIGWLEADWPAETTRYAYWGSGIYAEASSGAAQSSRLDEWLQAGGASLCHQAADRLGLGRWKKGV